MDNRVFNLEDIEHRQLANQSEVFSLTAVLSDLVGFKNLFVHHEILSPGKRSSSPHAHSKMEEMALVLEGNPTAWLGSENRQLKPGDFIGFMPSERHYIENTTTRNARVLMICSNDVEDETISD